ncbi:hypothetical protein [Variovorax sp.]|jgi:hypothetical protein|uniref:hypothetical protein n=1 Tax=unclassified Variovorax TaxID=663243 RepID=UPI001201B8FC|nr:hypothetical protein [Variovorax sp.]TAJ64731.1 MAG: hypothetical protein EPO53_11105 [Variovorax sp.]
MFKGKFSTLVFLLCGAAYCHAASSLELITDAEAKLPSAYLENKRAGLTRGPGIEVASPSTEAGREAVALKIGFKPRGGVVIDPKTVKVQYMKEPVVDLTERVRPYISDTGIAIDAARVPAGEHQLRVQVGDAEGRVSSKLIQFKAQ